MRIEAIALRGFPPFADAEHRFEVPLNAATGNGEPAEAPRIVELAGSVIRFPTQPNSGVEGEVHLLTGANGSGKTRLLCLLAAACGNSDSLDARDCRAEGANQIVVANHGGFRSVWMRSRGKAARTARLVADDRQLLSMCRDGEILHQSHWAASIVATADEPGAIAPFDGKPWKRGGVCQSGDLVQP